MLSNSVAWSLGRERMAPPCKYSACYKTLYRTPELDGFFGRIWFPWEADVNMKMKLSYYSFSAL
jgi:hypothetical protein